MRPYHRRALGSLLEEVSEEQRFGTDDHPALVALDAAEDALNVDRAIGRLGKERLVRALARVHDHVDLGVGEVPHKVARLPRGAVILAATDPVKRLERVAKIEAAGGAVRVGIGKILAEAHLGLGAYVLVCHGAMQRGESGGARQWVTRHGYKAVTHTSRPSRSR